MRSQTILSTHTALLLLPLALLAAGGALAGACSAEFETQCPDGTEQVAGGGDVSDACKAVGAAGSTGGGAGGGGAPAASGGAAGQGGGAAGGGSGQGGAGGGAGQGGGGAGGAPGPTALVRFAHLSPDAPAFDVCLSATGAFDEPPVLKAAGLASGLNYTNVSTYLAVEVARSRIRLVPAGSEICAQALPNTADATFVNAAENGYYTIAAMGKVTANIDQNLFKIFRYEDQDSRPLPEQNRLYRFIHAGSDLQSVGVTTYLGRPVYADDRIKFGKTPAQPSSLWTNGYFKHDSPLSTQPGVDHLISDQPDPTLNYMRLEFPLADKEIATTFLVGEYSASPRTLRALVCLDRTSLDSSALLTSCNLLGQVN